MMRISERLTRKILAELPSKSLREEIEKRNYTFTDEELFLIVANFCPLFRRRQTLLKEIAGEAEENTAKWANAYLDYEKKKLAGFAAPAENAKYLARIEEKGYAGTDDYLFESFEKLQNFWRRYDGKIYRMKAEKKPYADAAASPDDLAYLGYCELDGKGRILQVETGGRGCEWGICESGDCGTCKNPDGRNNGDADDKEILFPTFFKDYDLVKYLDYGKETVYGFTCLHNTEDLLETAYVIRLDEETVRYAYGMPLGFNRDKKYFSDDLDAVFFEAHDHVPLPLLEKAAYGRLPTPLKFVYDRLTNEHKKLTARRSGRK